LKKEGEYCDDTDGKRVIKEVAFNEAAAAWRFSPECFVATKCLVK
jgi:hypothetical protein